MTESEFLDLLRRCHPFIVHALATTPPDSLEWRQALALCRDINRIAYPEVEGAFRELRENTSSSIPQGHDFMAEGVFRPLSDRR